MDCPRCRNYFPDEEPSCPYCGCAVSAVQKNAARAQKRQEFALKQGKAYQKAQEQWKRTYETRAVSASLIQIRQHAKTRTWSAVTRGVVGGLLLGPIGTALGMMSADKHAQQTARFTVRYADGRIGTEEVKVGSARYEQLLRLCFE